MELTCYIFSMFIYNILLYANEAEKNVSENRKVSALSSYQFFFFLVILLPAKSCCYRKPDKICDIEMAVCIETGDIDLYLLT